jgi:hypothetical protein
MAILSKLRKDLERSIKGDVLKWEGITFYVAEYMNPDHKARLQQLTSEARQALRDGENLNADQIAELIVLSEAECVLLGWEDMEDFAFDDEGQVILNDAGEPEVIEVPYSAEKAAEILRDPEYVELREAIHKKASKRADYRQRFLEEAEGN